MATKIGTFKGNRTITLNPDSKYPFSFGTAKAQLILDNLEAIRSFVANQEAAAQEGNRGGDRFDMAVEDAMARRCDY